MNRLELWSHSPEETLALGRRLGELLVPGSVLALVGDLGAGKTLLTRGLARGLGVQAYERVNSPTFVLKQEYVGRLHLHHFDTYRLSGSAELLALGFEETLREDAVVVVEWADRVVEAMPDDALTVELEHVGEGAGDAAVDSGKRSLTLTWHSPAWSAFVNRLKESLPAPRNSQ